MTDRMMNNKAVLLLSGGLDSTLAAKVLLEQGIELTALNFTSPFCNCQGRKDGCRNQAAKVAGQMGIPLKVILKGLDYIKIVEKPRHGRGSQMNPCVDCRIYILRKAKELMEEIGASFVATGEVLGQRPMSQQRHLLNLIERESGLAGRILRPLSALHLEPTLPEQEGLVVRERLLNIAGRGRKQQIMLASDKGIKDYPCPAGGCLLTEKSVAKRLVDLFRHRPDYDLKDVKSLVYGRHFRLSDRMKLVVGRNEEENKILAGLTGPSRYLVTPANFRGPAALISGEADQENMTKVGEILAAYSQDVREQYEFNVEDYLPGPFFSVSKKNGRQEYDALRIDA